MDNIIHNGPTVSILSIDAWRNAEGGWDWNNWHKVGVVAVSICDLKPRALLNWMRKAGYLAEGSQGKCAIDDDQYNVVIVNRRTGEPIYAIAYGEVQ